VNIVHASLSLDNYVHITQSSHVHRKRHVTTYLMKFAVGKRNVAIRYKFCVSVV